MLATAVEARFLPVMVINEPGVMFVLPSLAFTIAPAPVLIMGCVLAPAGASEITLSPESVMTYAVVPAESATIIRGSVLNLVVPKTLTTGFSGTGPTSDTAPAFRSIIWRVVRESSRVAVVMFWRTGVVSHRKAWSFNGATAVTLRLPVFTIVALGGAPPGAPGVTVVAPGEAEPPRVVSEVFRIRPFTRK